VKNGLIMSLEIKTLGEVGCCILPAAMTQIPPEGPALHLQVSHKTVSLPPFMEH
jgi:hypothetical protein